MISLHRDIKQGRIRLRVTLLDDLWYLSHLIVPGDRVTAKTERKLKIGGEQSTKTVRKTLTLTLLVTDVQLEDDKLKVKGTVDLPHDDVPKGAYHSFSLGLQDSCTIVKDSWPRFLVHKLDDALHNDPHLVLVVLFDRDKALFTKASHTGIDHLTELRLDIQKKQFDSSSSSGFAEITKQIVHYDSDLSPKTIVLAGPAFWKDSLTKSLPSTLRKKIAFIPWTTISRSAVSHLLAHTELKERLANHRLQQEQSFVDFVLKELSRENLAYGFDDVVVAAKNGAVKDIGVSENFLKSSREKNTYAQLDELLVLVDQSHGRIHFVSANELQKTIVGLGGVVAVLRWK